MNDLAGPVALALVGLWVAYLVPGKLRHRQQLLESRVDDRYSEALRVVAVTAGDAGVDDRRSARVLRTARAPRPGTGHAGTTGLLTPGKGTPALVDGARTGGSTVDRPHATPERTTADAARRAAQARAARTASAARRAAAARRRAVLAGALVVATVAGWGVVALAPTVTLVAGIVPTVLLASVLGLGRRAVVSGRRTDAELAAQISEQDRLASAPHSGATRAVAAARRAGLTTGEQRVAPAAAPAEPVRTARSTAEQPLVTGRAVHPSDTSTQMFSTIVADRGERGATVRHATGATPVVERAAAKPAPKATEKVSGSAISTAPAAADAEGDETGDDRWEPIPVPRPTYTMKPAAPRREPVALGEVEASTAVRPADAEVPAVVDDGEVRTPVAPVQTTGSIDLNAVLAKRRAAGE